MIVTSFDSLAEVSHTDIVRINVAVWVTRTFLHPGLITCGSPLVSRYRGKRRHTHANLTLIAKALADVHSAYQNFTNGLTKEIYSSVFLYDVSHGKRELCGKPSGLQ